MTERNQRLGEAGERIASRYLEQQGYEVVDRNIRRPHTLPQRRVGLPPLPHMRITHNEDPSHALLGITRTRYGERTLGTVRPAHPH